MAIDFLLQEGEPVVTEMSYTTGVNPPYDPRIEYPGFWNRKLNWVPGFMSFTDAEAEEFLKEISERNASSMDSAPDAIHRCLS